VNLVASSRAKEIGKSWQLAVGSWQSSVKTNDLKTAREIGRLFTGKEF